MSLGYHTMSLPRGVRKGDVFAGDGRRGRRGDESSTRAREEEQEMNERITVWVTKYALTKGVLRFDGAEVRSDIFPGTIEYDGYYFHDNWHRTEAAAIARAEEMRTAKIASLKKQIAKLEKLRFGGVK